MQPDIPLHYCAQDRKKGMVLREERHTFACDITFVGEIFDKCAIAENHFTSCLLLII